MEGALFTPQGYAIPSRRPRIGAVKRRPLLLLCTAACTTSCREAGAPPASAASAPPSGSGSASGTDAASLRGRILRSIGRGGHGPLAQRAVNAESLAALSGQWQAEDAAACLELLADEDALVRLSCLHLLARHRADAVALVEARRAALPSGATRRHLDNALIELRNLR